MASFATSEEVEEWNLRADVLYHFHAYQYFLEAEKGSVLNMVNLTDADIQFYNRTSDMIRGLGTKHDLAQYLAKFKLATHIPMAETHRLKLIAHVRLYNETVAPRRRFYLIGLSSNDITFLEDLSLLQAAGNKDKVAALGGLVFTWATDGCLDLQKEDDVMQERAVERKIKKCLKEWNAEHGVEQNDETYSEEDSDKFDEETGEGTTSSDKSM